MYCGGGSGDFVCLSKELVDTELLDVLDEVVVFRLLGMLLDGVLCSLVLIVCEDSAGWATASLLSLSEVLVVEPLGVPVEERVICISNNIYLKRSVG